jgi:hypothetical protein
MVKVGLYTLDYSMFEQTGHVFAAYGLKKAERRIWATWEKRSGLEIVPTKRWTSYSCPERY